ncbi:ABC transporter ATP-binding protein (plasmid) [Bacillus cereus]|uniref:ABC transporter ATP-binding protein n=1 Tax=Bacillus cereus TaxID=1396 RepID=A0AB73USW2_BACCE|nr:ABC transporter ATP-binding protein [Bacillus cereus]HDR3523475.1 ABC transporter ATP-binding protein [Bacillus pacificus]QHV07968.1 hypothetical protein C1N82_32750 [Bacillus cereus]QHV47428.1 ABC transporter ATP-binding protein [Bacillus cereus]HDR3634032.1 ABC transporter ATP-binding protein [Bacillus pacificus]HDR7652968.1 ABC transporter ATP-binding protein [Bacillus pacificus]
MKRKWIFYYVRKCYGVYALAIFLLLVSVITYLGITGIQKYIIDDVFMKSNFTNLTTYVLLFCGIAFTYLFSWVTKDILFERIDNKLKVLMRQDYMQSLFKITVKTYQNERLGSITSQINELLRTSSIFAYKIPRVIENIANLLFLTAIIWITSPLLLACLLLFATGYIFVGRHFSPYLEKSTRDIQRQKAELNVQFEEGISSTREVIAFNRESWEERKIDSSFQQYFNKLLEDVKLRNRQMLWTDPLNWAGNIMILAIGGYGVMEGKITIGLFVVVYQFGNQFIQSVYAIFQSVMELKESFVAVENANLFLQKEKIYDGNRLLKEHIQTIKLNDISFGYYQNRPLVLNGISLKIEKGKKIALVGPSGGGKSTVAQLLVRFYEPQQGSILINGIPLHELNRKEWTEKVSIVFQDTYLFPDTIENNIKVGRDYTREQVINACKIAEIHDHIMCLPDTYDTVIGERGITLSGGQRQRIAIARAILSQPELLILDEATSALDQETERKVQHNLDKIRKNKTTLVIAHRLSTVENADVINVIKDGRVIESGKHDELLALRGYYCELVLNSQESLMVTTN